RRTRRPRCRRPPSRSPARSRRTALAAASVASGPAGRRSSARRRRHESSRLPPGLLRHRGARDSRLLMLGSAPFAAALLFAAPLALLGYGLLLPLSWLRALLLLAGLLLLTRFDRAAVHRAHRQHVNTAVQRKDLVQQLVRAVRLDLDAHHLVGEHPAASGSGPRIRCVLQVDEHQRHFEIDRRSLM